MKKTGILVINETSFIINDGLTFIGRDPATCTVILANVTISKQHALAIKINDNFYISDLQSTNGTKLEEVSLQPRFCYEIIDNAILTFGDVKCKFIIQEYDAIFKTPIALSKRSSTASKISLDTTKLVSTNIHDLPTQLEDGFQDTTQQLLDKSAEETQILESSIIDSPNISKIRSNISKTKNTDDFMIPETQSEYLCPETQKHFEIDESNNSEQFELSNLDISDTQMAEVHDSIIQSPPKIKTHERGVSKVNIYNLETQNINEAEAQIELDPTKTTDIHNLSTQNLTSNASSKTLDIYEMETQLFEKNTPRKPSPKFEQNLHEAETQLLSTQPIQKHSHKKFSSPQSNKNLHEAETQLLDTQNFETPQKSSLPNRNIHEAETQLLNAQEDTPQLKYESTRIKITATTNSGLSSGNNSEAQLMKDKMDHEISADSGEPHIENDDLAETQFDFDAEPNIIETPKLETISVKPTESNDIREVKRVIGKNKAIIFTQEDSQVIDSQSEPEMAFGMKKRVIGNSKPINFTQSPTIHNGIDILETQFDEEDIPITNNILEINKNKKISPNTSTLFSDSDSSLNHSVKNNIRNIILNFEAATKNSSNTSTPNRSSLENRSGGYHHKITKNVETEISGIPVKVPDDVVVEIESSSVTNCLSNFISNTSVQHKVYYKSKIGNKVVEEIDIPKTLPGESKSDSNSTKAVQDSSIVKKSNLIVSESNTDIDEMFDDSTQLMDSENCPENESFIKANSSSSNTKEALFSAENVPSKHTNFHNSTQNFLAENDGIGFLSPNIKQPTFAFKTPTSVIRERSTVAEDDSIFEQSTLILNSEQIDSPSSKFNTPNINVLKKIRDDKSVFCTPSQIRTNQKAASSDTSSSDIEIYDMPTQVMEKPSNIPKTVSTIPTKKNHRNEETDTDLFDMPTQVITNNEEKKTSQRCMSEVPETNDIFDVPTQTFETVKNNLPKAVANKELKKTSEPGLSDASNAENFDIFDIPTQALGTIENNSSKILMNKQIKKSFQPGLSEVSNTVETHDIFDIPTQASETIKKNSPKTFDGNLSEKLLHDEDLENILNNDPKTPEICNLATNSSTDDLSINKKPAKRHARKTSESSTQKLKQKTINREKNNTKFTKLDDEESKQNHCSNQSSSSSSSSNQSKSAKDSDCETDKKSVDKSPKMDNEYETDKVKKTVDKSSKTDSENTKRSLRGNNNPSTSTKVSDCKTDKEKKSAEKSPIAQGDRETDKVKNIIDKSSKTDGENTKRSLRVSSNQSTSTKDSVCKTDKEKKIVDKFSNEDDDCGTSKVKKSVEKSCKMNDKGTKRSLRGSRNQCTSDESDRETDIVKKNIEKEKSIRKSKQNKRQDVPINNNKDTEERVEMVVSAIKEVINKKLINVDKPSDRDEICQTSSNRSTRSSRKRTDTATETNLEIKKRKTLNNKQTVVEENNNTNNEKNLKKQKSEETIKLTRNNRTANQQSTNSTNDAPVEVLTRPVRKSKIPLKTDSQSEENTTNRKRGHPQSSHQTTSESNVGVTSSKIQKLGTNYVPTKDKFRVMFTIFRDEEQEQTVKKLGGKVVEKSKEANVLVTNQIKRSVKLLNAVSQGIPIVSPRWLDICKHAKTFVDPWQFLLYDSESEKRFKFSLQESLNIAKQNGLLFQGYTALLTKSVPTDLKDILENAGAKCVTSWPKNTTDKHIIVSSMEDKSQWPKQSKVIIVAAEAIFSSVVRQKIDLKNYLLV